MINKRRNSDKFYKQLILLPKVINIWVFTFQKTYLFIN